MHDFWVNFLANLFSDVFLAIAIYYIVTQPGEQKRLQESKLRTLGMLKSEAQINQERASFYINELSKPESIDINIFPLQFTRGAWNTVKETGFFLNLDDPQLVYLLFRMNETCHIANRNLRRYELAHLEDTGGDIQSLAMISLSDTEKYSRAVNRVLVQLEHVDSVGYEFEDLSVPEVLDTEEEEEAKT